MTALDLIAEERQRQITEEGWITKHDDQHTMAELSGAAACYVIAANESAVGNTIHPPMVGMWPWLDHWWKPSPDPIRNLVKAGALIVAEIERLQRKASAS